MGSKQEHKNATIVFFEDLPLWAKSDFSKKESLRILKNRNEMGLTTSDTLLSVLIDDSAHKARFYADHGLYYLIEFTPLTNPRLCN